MTTMYRPAAMIAAAALYDTLAYFSSLPESQQNGLTVDRMGEAVARQMVVELGQKASPLVLFKILGAIGEPATMEELHARVRAASEAARQEAGQESNTPPAPASAPTGEPPAGGGAQ